MAKTKDLVNNPYKTPQGLEPTSSSEKMAKNYKVSGIGGGLIGKTYTYQPESENGIISPKEKEKAMFKPSFIVKKDPSTGAIYAARISKPARRMHPELNTPEAETPLSPKQAQHLAGSLIKENMPPLEIRPSGSTYADGKTDNKRLTEDANKMMKDIPAGFNNDISHPEIMNLKSLVPSAEDEKKRQEKLDRELQEKAETLDRYFGMGKSQKEIEDLAKNDVDFEALLEMPVSGFSKLVGEPSVTKYRRTTNDKGEAVLVPTPSPMQQKKVDDMSMRKFYSKYYAEDEPNKQRLSPQEKAMERKESEDAFQRWMKEGKRVLSGDEDFIEWKDRVEKTPEFQKMLKKDGRAEADFLLDFSMGDKKRLDKAIFEREKKKQNERIAEIEKNRRQKDLDDLHAIQDKEHALPHVGIIPSERKYTTKDQIKSGIAWYGKAAKDAQDKADGLQKRIEKEATKLANKEGITQEQAVQELAKHYDKVHEKTHNALNDPFGVLNATQGQVETYKGKKEELKRKLATAPEIEDKTEKANREMLSGIRWDDLDGDIDQDAIDEDEAAGYGFDQGEKGKQTIEKPDEDNKIEEENKEENSDNDGDEEVLQADYEDAVDKAKRLSDEMEGEEFLKSKEGEKFKKLFKDEYQKLVHDKGEGHITMKDIDGIRKRSNGGIAAEPINYDTAIRRFGHPLKVYDSSKNRFVDTNRKQGDYYLVYLKNAPESAAWAGKRNGILDKKEAEGYTPILLLRDDEKFEEDPSTGKLIYLGYPKNTSPAAQDWGVYEEHPDVETSNENFEWLSGLAGSGAKSAFQNGEKNGNGIDTTRKPKSGGTSYADLATQAKEEDEKRKILKEQYGLDTDQPKYVPSYDKDDDI